MNTTLMGALARQRLTSPMRMALLFVMAGMPLLTLTFIPRMGLAGLGAGNFIAMIFAAGMIGQDVSSGTLQLLFARPVTRTEYVLSRWAGATLATLGVVVVQLAIALVLLVPRGHAPSGTEIAVYLGTNVSLAIGVVAVMALFSALAPALGDLGLFGLVFFLSLVLQGLGSMMDRPAFVRASLELQQFLGPQIDAVQWIQGGTVPWASIVAWLSTITLCLALAIVIVNRKELSYASSSG